MISSYYFDINDTSKIYEIKTIDNYHNIPIFKIWWELYIFIFLNQNIFENVRIKPDVIVRCRRSGVYIIHILSSTPQLHWKSRKYILSQRILNDASCCHDDQISLSHLGAYCIVVAYSKLYDHHQINKNFVYRCYEFYSSPYNKIY